MNIIIIDDEKIAIDVLIIKLNRLTQFQIFIKEAFTNAADALIYLEKESVDVIFLDIEMIDMHGLKIAKQLLIRQPSIQIIFVTAHAQFAVDAFEIEATDYLLKPVNEKRLIKALTKALQKMQLQAVNVPKKKKEKRLFAHIFGSVYLLNAQHEVMKWRTRKVKELFLYLWFHQKRPMLNVVIIEDLWPDLEFDKAASNLYTSIYQLRKLLKENSIKDPIQLVNYHYQLNAEIDSDYDELKELLEKENHDEASIQQLLNCYEGDLLAEEEYPWAIQIQLRLKQGVMHVIEMYIENSTSNNYLLKFNCLQKLLELDEFNERYMFLLLDFLIQQNKKQDCSKCYESIRTKLAEINEPVPEKINKIYNEYMSNI